MRFDSIAAVVFGILLAYSMYRQDKVAETKDIAPGWSPNRDGHAKWRDVDDDSLYYGSRINANFVSKHRLLFRLEEYELAMVADLDLKSRDPQEFKWKSYLIQATLRRNGPTNFTLHLQEPRPLYTHTATRNRSMELSELVRFRHLLLAMCDYTGLVFKIVPDHSHVFQRYAIADGDGNAAKPAKMEWATVKEGRIWVGGVGMEWIDKNGRILHRNAEWVKTIDMNGRVENYDWGPVYQALRLATNATAPGYLWHEAVHWDSRSNRWIFLPRKRSFELYSPQTDETKGTNLLIIASEDFADIEVRTIGPVEPQYGFTAVRKVPGTEDMFAALKVKEIGDETHTKFVVFDLDGNLYLEPGWQHIADMKYEGLDFL